MSRPPLGKLGVGDRVFVIRSSNLSRGLTREQRTHEAEVVSAARVWCVLREVGKGALIGRHWKMRLDDQDEGNRMYPQNNDRFVTPEQLAYEVRRDDALQYLRAQGIRLEGDSPWHGGREAELADLIRAAADA